MRKEQQVAIVTGGTRGIGQAIVRALVGKGYAVVLTYRNDDKAAKALQRQMKALDANIVIRKSDVGIYENARDIIGQVVRDFGRIDVLVNNAGEIIDQPLYLMQEEEWDQVIRTNLKGTFNFCKAATPHMIRQRRGRIINMASVSALHGVVGQTNYSAAKGAIVAFSRSLAKELGRFNITVNVLSPGLIETEMIRNISKESRATYLQRIPLGRLGKPTEVAEAAMFLIDAGTYLTGSVIVVDGGMSA